MHNYVPVGGMHLILSPFAQCICTILPYGQKSGHYIWRWPFPVLFPYLQVSSTTYPHRISFMVQSGCWKMLLFHCTAIFDDPQEAPGSNSCCCQSWCPVNCDRKICLEPEHTLMSNVSAHTMVQWFAGTLTILTLLQPPDLRLSNPTDPQMECCLFPSHSRLSVHSE